MSHSIYDYLNKMTSYQLEYILWLHEQHGLTHGIPEAYELARQILRERRDTQPENLDL